MRLAEKLDWKGLTKEQGCLALLSDYGAQRARFKAWVQRDRKGSNPTMNLNLININLTKTFMNFINLYLTNSLACVLFPSSSFLSSFF
jgi:hypothetical protein